MKVYIFCPEAPWSGGCMIIAAHEKRQARKIARFHHGKYIDEGHLEKELTAPEGDARVIVDEVYYE